VRVPTLFVLAALLGSTTSAAAQTSIHIDLLSGKINGKPFYEYTLDGITDLLGRPNSVEHEGIRDWSDSLKLYEPGTLAYTDLGLYISLSHSAFDADRHVESIEIFLSQNRRDDLLFEQFDGTLAPPITGAWKLKKILQTIPGARRFDMGDGALVPGVAWVKNSKWKSRLDFSGYKIQDTLTDDGGAAYFFAERATEFLEIVQLVVGPTSMVRVPKEE